ncbi:hypothetical protein [Chryseobacterium gregarium]|uniref:hypothetical protein n=1 Tax=Chryseobacterium gregarium TaxID=456299 RepID=UPI0003FDA52C|nr:hypothetical protein [Chryseobacterium gregarium]
MKNKIITGGMLILLVLAVAFKFESLKIYFTNAAVNTGLPGKFENYHDLKSEKTIRFGSYEMKRAFHSFEPVRHFISSHHHLIVITTRIPEDRDAKAVQEDQYGGGSRVYQDFITYKLNKDGDLLDRYIYKRTSKNYSEILFGDYMVNPERGYYKTWILDGDPAEKPFILQNKDLKWDQTQQTGVFKKIISEAAYYTIDGDNYASGGDRPKQQIIYFLNNIWYKLFLNGLLPDRENIDDQKGETTYLSNLFGKYSDNEWGEAPDWKNFKPVYFQRVKMDHVTHNIGGGSPSSQEVVWKGNLFCQLYVDRDTLKFKKPMVLGESGETNQFFESEGEKITGLKNEFEKYYYPYFYYTDKTLNVKLFTADKNELYLIRPVK